MTDRKVNDQAQGMMITLNVNREELKDVDMDTVLFTVSEEERLLRSPRTSRKRSKKSPRTARDNKEEERLLKSPRTSRKRSKKSPRTARDNKESNKRRDSRDRGGARRRGAPTREKRREASRATTSRGEKEGKERKEKRDRGRAVSRRTPEKRRKARETTYGGEKKAERERKEKRDRAGSGGTLTERKGEVTRATLSRRSPTPTQEVLREPMEEAPPPPDTPHPDSVRGLEVPPEDPARTARSVKVTKEVKHLDEDLKLAFRTVHLIPKMGKWMKRTKREIVNAGGARECKLVLMTAKLRHEEIVRGIRSSIGATMKKGTPTANGAWYAVRIRSKAVWEALDKAAAAMERDAESWGSKKSSMVEGVVETLAEPIYNMCYF